MSCYTGLLYLPNYHRMYDAFLQVLVHVLKILSQEYFGGSYACYVYKTIAHFIVHESGNVALPNENN